MTFFDKSLLHMRCTLLPAHYIAEACRKSGPIIELRSSDDPDERICVEPALGKIFEGKLVQDQPTQAFFKRITVSDGQRSIEILLDFAAVHAPCGHLTAVVEIARGGGYASNDACPRGDAQR